MKRALFIEHDHVSPPGPVGAAFERHGYELEEFLVVPGERFADPAVDVEYPDPTEYDVVVPMGAPWSVYDDVRIGSWLRKELQLLQRADEHGVPVLGICFGGQALAAALGGHVELAPEGELGWVTLDSDEPGLVDPGPWFQWHQDRWAMPPAARELARTHAASQAFVLRRNLGVQFHPELTLPTLQGWLDNGGVDYVRAKGGDPQALVDQTREQERGATQRAQALVDRFLAHVANRKEPVG